MKNNNYLFFFVEIGKIEENTRKRYKIYYAANISECFSKMNSITCNKSCFSKIKQWEISFCEIKF